MSVEVRQGATWRQAAPFVRSGGVWRVPIVVYARHAGVWRAAGQGIDSVSCAPSSQGAFFGSTATITATAVGFVAGLQVGYGELWYSWSIVSGPGSIVAGAGASTVTVTSAVRGTTTYRCKVMDGLTGQAVSAGAWVEWT